MVRYLSSSEVMGLLNYMEPLDNFINNFFDTSDLEHIVNFGHVSKLL